VVNSVRGCDTGGQLPHRLAFTSTQPQGIEQTADIERQVTDSTTIRDNVLTFFSGNYGVVGAFSYIGRCSVNAPKVMLSVDPDISEPQRV
jgi:hypothetical protein